MASLEQMLVGHRADQLYCHQRRDNEVQLLALDTARILRPVRIDVDLQKRAFADRNAYPNLDFM
jgi:hypothetical protein